MKTGSYNPQIQVDLILQNHNMTLEVDTGAGDNFLSIDKWRKLGSPAFSKSQVHYESATKDRFIRYEFVLSTLGYIHSNMRKS